MNRSTWIAVAVCALLGVAVWKSESWFPKTPASKVIYEWAEADVTKVELLEPVDQAWACGKEGTVWKMTAPAPHDLEDHVVQELARRLAKLEVTRKLSADPKDLEGYGLSKPEWVFRVSSKSGQSKTIHVGRQTPDHQQYYVKEVGEATVCAAPVWAIDPLKKSVSDLRKKELWNFPTHEVRKITVSGAHAKVFLKDPKTGWSVDGRPAESGPVDQWVASLRYLRPSKFPDDHPKDLKKYGLAPPWSTVTVWGEDPKSPVLKVFFGRESGFGRYFRVEGRDPVYEVESYQADPLFHPAKEYLSSKKIVSPS